jgi:hypothetical protein
VKTLKEVAHRHFKDALVKQFNAIYGTDEDDLGEWQNLCHIVDIYLIPDDLEACREASTFVPRKFCVSDRRY